jgi:hypothetical protein
MLVSPLKYPLTKKAIRETFADLGISADDITLFDRTEAAVSGSWSFTRLSKLFVSKGFAYIREPNGGRFINADRTVGLVCQGVTPHPTLNKWKTFDFEIQARSLRAAILDP